MALKIKGRSYIRIKNVRTNRNVIVDNGADDNTTNVWLRPNDDATDNNSWLFIFADNDHSGREVLLGNMRVRMRGVNFDPYLKYFPGGPAQINAQRGPVNVGTAFRLVTDDETASPVDDSSTIMIQELEHGGWLVEKDQRIGLVADRQSADHFMIELVSYDDDPANFDKNPRAWCLQACGRRRQFFGTPREAFNAAEAFAREVNDSGTFCPVGHATEGACP